MYPVSFYEHQAERTAASAKALVSVVLGHLSPKSVIDIGCGVGVWVREFKRSGVRDVMGVDQASAIEGLQLIHPPEFVEHDLEQPIHIGRTFDLVICLETIEHLSKARGPSLIRELTQLGPAILFSAAIPLQCGYNHINEQWPEYWQREFSRWNYTAIDCIRPHVWNNKNIEWWYRQNTILYVRDSYLSHFSDTASVRHESSAVMRLIHPEMWVAHLSFVDADKVPESEMQHNPRLKDLHVALKAGKENLQRYLVELLTEPTERHEAIFFHPRT